MPFNDTLTHRLVSLLPYPVDFCDSNGAVLHRFEAAKNPVRIFEKRDEATVDFLGVGHVPTMQVTSTLSRIPPPTVGISYIVSLRILQLLSIQGYDTTDMYAPYELIWDKDGPSGQKRLQGFRKLIQAVDAP